MVGTVPAGRPSDHCPPAPSPVRSDTAMTRRPPRGPVLLVALMLGTLTGAARLQAQVPPDKQAEMALNAARKAYNDGNLPAARDLFKQALAKFGTPPHATAARYGLALCLINAPEQDFAAAVEPLTQAASDGGFAERGQVLYHLALCQR